jgi:hypothetical protein
MKEFKLLIVETNGRTMYTTIKAPDSNAAQRLASAQYSAPHIRDVRVTGSC